jgi:hypothetical protein
VNQNRIVIALTEANDEKSTAKSSTAAAAEHPKFFVDLAANHAVDLSNSLFLEQNGWKGICIEGNPQYW